MTMNKLAQALLLTGTLTACAEPTPEMEAGKAELAELRDETREMCWNMTRTELNDPDNKSMAQAAAEREKVVQKMGCEDSSHWVCSNFNETSSFPKFGTYLLCEGRMWHLDLNGDFMLQR